MRVQRGQVIKMDSNSLEFIVPLPVEKCVWRLETRHEKMVWFSWDWQRRTWVKVRQQGPGTYQFTLKRVAKNTPFHYGSAALVRGYLRRFGTENTTVLVEKHLPYLSIVFCWLLVVVMVAMLLGVQDMQSSKVLLFVGVVGTTALGGIFFSWRRARSQMWVLIHVLKENIGGEVVSRW